MGVSHAEATRASEGRSALPFHRRNPSTQAEGALGPAVSLKAPLELCVDSVQSCACSRERSVCISSKAITLIKNVTCKSWPHYTLTLSQDLGLQRGREAQHEHATKPLLLPKDHKELETQILSFGTGVRLQPFPWNVHSHTSPVLRHTTAVRLACHQCPSLSGVS